MRGKGAAPPWSHNLWWVYSNSHDFTRGTDCANLFGRYARQAAAKHFAGHGWYGWWPWAGTCGGECGNRGLAAYWRTSRRRPRLTWLPFWMYWGGFEPQRQAAVCPWAQRRKGSPGPCAYHCKSLTQLAIPSSVTSIEDFASHECLSLEQVTIPTSVISFGAHAFHRCLLLKQIEFLLQWLQLAIHLFMSVHHCKNYLF